MKHRMKHTRKHMPEDWQTFIAMVVTGALLFGLMVVVSLLGGCATDKPPAFITTDNPPLPEECTTAATPEPKIPGGGKRDVMVDEAARDREALRAAYRNERILRAACKQRLQVLFPAKDGKP